MYCRNLKFFFALTTIIFWLSIPLFAQTSYQADIYTTKDGLSSELCRNMYRDKDGFLWISTDKGLNRFDGNSFYTFRHRPDDPNSIANNSCNGILEDSKGRLWVNTDDGLSLFDKKKQTFKNYYPDTSVMAILGISYTDMAEDHAGRIWIGGYFDVLIFDPSTEKFEKSGWYDFAVSAGIVEVESRNSITQSVVKKSEKEIWLMTVYGLFSVHTATKAYTYHPSSKLDDYFAFVIRHIDKDGILWIGTYDQCFYTYDPLKKKWSHFTCPPKEKGLSDLIFNINNYDENTLMITRTDHLFLYDVKFKKFIKFEWEGMKDGSDGSVYSNTLISGDEIYLIKSGSQPFIHLTKKRPLVNKLKIPLPKNFVNNHSYITPTGKVLTGDWEKGAVFVCDSLTCVLLSEINGNTNLGNLQLYYHSKKGDQYFSTSSHVYKWNESENTVRLLSDHNIVSDINQTEFRNFTEDIRGNIYVRERSKGIFILGKGKEKLDFFDSNIQDDNFSAIYYDKETDKIWLATEKKGLYIIDPLSRQFKNYSLYNLAQTQKGFIYDISGDDLGNVFLLIANRGMIRMNSGDMIPKLYTTSNGLLSDAVRYGCLDRDIFWFTSESGLMAFDYKKDRFYSFENEVDSKLFNYRIFVDTDGNITQNLYPEQIIEIKHNEFANHNLKENIYLKEVKLSGKIIPNDTLFNVSYRQNNFVFLFGNLGGKKLNAQEFQYRINGQSWQSLENSTISFYNMSPGNYQIEVANKYDLNSILALQVLVVPPWWKTTWFYIIAIIFLSFGGYIMYKKRISKIRNEESEKNQLKERIAKMEMTALRAQMNPHFIFNCLNSINRFILVNDTDAASEYLTKFSRLIRMILDASREDVIPLQRELDGLRLYIGMEAMRFQDSFEWQIDVDVDVQTENVFLPPLLLQPYVENAIWHGLMQAPPDWGLKKLRIHISSENNGETAVITISDNGIGREKAGQMRSKDVDGRKSYGVMLAQERLKLLSVSNGNESDVFIKDIKSPDGKAEGTSVIIRLTSLIKNTEV